MFIIRKWMIYTAMVIFLVMTTPDQYAHEQKVRSIFEDPMTEETAPESNSTYVSLTTSPDITYHNIYLFTYTLYNRRVLTFGAFGFVFDVGS